MRTKWRGREEARFLEGPGGNSIQFSPTYLHPPGASQIFPPWQGRPLRRPPQFRCGHGRPAGLLPPRTACPRAAKPAKSAEDPTFGEEIQTVLSPEFSNNFKMFHEALLPPIEQTQPPTRTPPAWNLHTSDDISDARKLDFVFEYFQTQPIPAHWSLFSKGLFSATDRAASLWITLSPGSCRRLLALLVPPPLTTGQVRLLLDDRSPGSAHSQDASWPAPRGKRERGPWAWCVCVDEDHRRCHQPTPRLPPSSTEPAALTGSLGPGLFLLTLSAATFSSDKGLGQAMKDISQNLLYASSYKYLAFLGPRHLLVTDTFLGSLPHPVMDAGTFL